MIWSGIGLRLKHGPVIFQNIAPCEYNGVTTARCMDQTMRPNVVPFFAFIETTLSSVTTTMLIMLEPLDSSAKQHRDD